MARRFVSNNVWRQNQAEQAVEKAPASEMVLDFPGTVTLDGADICVFPSTGECHIDVHARMGNASIECTVGRLDPQSGTGRLTIASVQKWAESKGLVFSHEDEPATSRAGETFVVVHLLGKEGHAPDHAVDGLDQVGDFNAD